MAALDSFEQGESIGRTIVLTEKISGVVTAIDTLNFLTIVALVRHSKFNTDAGIYSLTNGKLVKLSPTADGKVFFDIPPSVSTDLRKGIYLYQITTTETDTDYDSNVRTRIFKGDCFKLIEKLT